MLIQCAWAAIRTKDSCVPAQFYRLRATMGPKKAICVVTASILTTIYHMLKNGTTYTDLGADHFDRRSKDAKVKRLMAQLTKMGLRVEITPLPAAA